MRSAMRNIQMFNTFTLTAIGSVLAIGALNSTTFAQTQTKLSRVLPLIRTDSTTAGENLGKLLPKGTVKL